MLWRGGGEAVVVDQLSQHKHDEHNGQENTTTITNAKGNGYHVRS